MPIRMILVFVLALALSSRAAPVSAQVITAKAAVKQAKSAAKTRLGFFASAVAGAQATVLSRIDAFDATVRGGSFTIPAVQALAHDLGDFQTAVQAALFDVAGDTAADGGAALVALAGGGVTLDEIPSALANLPGGLPEQVRTAIAKVLARTYKTLNKRLAKTSALVGKKGDATLFAVLAPPPQLHFAFSHLRAERSVFDFAIDLRMSARTPAGDTRIWVGGTTAMEGVNLLVTTISMNTPFTDDVPVTSEGLGRFLARSGDTLSLARTNYLLVVVPIGGSQSASAWSSFAIR